MTGAVGCVVTVLIFLGVYAAAMLGAAFLFAALGVAGDAVANIVGLLAGGYVAYRFFSKRYRV